jgi:glycosyltransferase involved in cell wall biosynthesis
MKILLLGEFSGLHQNLKAGLQTLGHEVTIASNGDLWKNIERDIDLSIKKVFPSVLGEIEYCLKFFPKFSLFSDYDVVQLIDASFFHRFYPEFIIRNIMDKIILKNRKIFLITAGNDSFYCRYGCKRLRYHPLDDYLKYDLKKKFFYAEKDKYLNINKMIAEKVNGVIPVMYEYEVGYRDIIDNLMPIIPLPIDVDAIEYIPNIPKDKIVVFHGLIRYGFKGTHHIEKAFKKLEKKYSNDVEFIIDGKMPLKKYLSVMKNVNIIVDQTSSYSCGMNAIYALAMGKIVLGGAEPESLDSLCVNKSPVINILPNPEDIVQKIESILEQRNDFERIGYESRKFVEEVHDHVKIAQKYLNTWNQCTPMKSGSAGISRQNLDEHDQGAAAQDV